MRATIYVTKAAWTLSQAIKDLDYYDRCTLSDDATTDPTGKEGYYLKNANVFSLRRKSFTASPSNSPLASFVVGSAISIGRTPHDMSLASAPASADISKMLLKKTCCLCPSRLH
jgi:hypothetical protein